jgi:hypothetical protein
MSLTDILIILGCLAGGYWIVSSVMGPGIDIMRRKPPDADRKEPPSAPPAVRLPQPPRATSSWRRPPTSGASKGEVNDWRIILDVPNTASRGDIEAAFRHQQKKAQAAGDAVLLQRLQQARDAGLASLKDGRD